MFRSRSIVLMYHRIASVRPDPWSLCVSPDHFAEHLEVLQNYHRVRLDQLGPSGWSVGRQHSVAITFDDGYADNLYEAARLLRRYDTPATFFITTGYIGAGCEFWWDELERVVPAQNYLTFYQKLQPLAHAERRQILNALGMKFRERVSCRPSHRPLTIEELQRLAAHELFEIGAHTVTHPLLAAQSAEEQYSEISGSKAWLQELLNRSVTSFSYPYGGANHYTPTAVRAVRDLGFSRACTTTARPIQKSDDSCQWGRMQVPDVGGDEFQQMFLM
jgi:peptidoglycan/xylan/chitin deacetylase (PgdA/CDA1 family)